MEKRKKFFSSKFIGIEKIKTVIFCVREGRQKNVEKRSVLFGISKVIDTIIFWCEV